jgi:hypothetical protein
MLADAISARASAELPAIGHVNGHESLNTDGDVICKAIRRRPDLRLYRGAGDGNRTRTISLGICAVRARYMA